MCGRAADTCGRGACRLNSNAERFDKPADNLTPTALDKMSDERLR